MAAIDFPNTIPNPSFPLKEDFEDNVIRSPFENGTVAQRSRFTRRRKIWPSVHWAKMTDTHKTRLDQFYDLDTDGGAADFNWTHPYSGQVKVVQFSGPPKATLIGPDHWDVEISLREV